MSNNLRDESQDKKYFVIVPQIVWSRCDSVYELALWFTIKMIASDTGECFLSTEDLAIAAMMSTGKVSECRKSLLEKELIKGHLRKDPGYPQPVWRLSIPDLWEENISWRKGNDSLKGRLDYKAYQKRLHHVKPSPDEEGTPPDEEGTPPDETKKNHKEEPQKNPSADSQKNISDDWFGETEISDDWFGETEINELPATSPHRNLAMLLGEGGGYQGNISAARAELDRSGWKIPQAHIRNGILAFMEATGFGVPPTDNLKKLWINEIKDHVEGYGAEGLESLYKQTYRKMMESGWDVNSPKSMTNVMAGVWQSIQKQRKQQTIPPQSEFSPSDFEDAPEGFWEEFGK